MGTDIRAEIGERLREERARMQLNQDQFAQLGDVKRRTLQDWERGIATPSGDFLAAAVLHGVDVLYVLTGRRAGAAEGLVMTAEESELLTAYRAAAPEKKVLIKGVADAMGGSAAKR